MFQIGRGFASWGELDYATDSTVRARVRQAGVALPEEAHDIHYAAAGFVDSSVWIRFTVPREKIWDVVRASIGKSESDFKDTYPEHILEEVWRGKGQAHDLSWWAPSSVASPKSWSNPKEQEGQHFFEDWLIDADTGTFFITRWDT